MVSRDRKPKTHNFIINSGPNLNLPIDAQPIDYFNLLFNEDLMISILTETNRYANEKIKRVLSPKSTWHKWTDVTLTEMKAFLGMIINMGLVNLPDLKDYWSSEWVTQVKFFGDVMARDRFLQIFWMLHVGNGDTLGESGLFRRTRKVHGVIEDIEKQFQKYFVPGKNIAIDESTV